MYVVLSTVMNRILVEIGRCTQRRLPLEPSATLINEVYPLEPGAGTALIEYVLHDDWEDFKTPRYIV